MCFQGDSTKSCSNCGRRNAACTLNIIIEYRACITVGIQKCEGSVIGEVLELEDAIRPLGAHGIDRFFNYPIVGIILVPLPWDTKIVWAVPDFISVASKVKGDW